MEPEEPRGPRGLRERATRGCELSPRERGGGDPAERWGSEAEAAAYDAWYETPLGRLVARLEREAVFALVPAAPGRRALDLSCGTGGYALGLAGRGYSVVGVDLSAAMLARAGARATGTGMALALVRADAAALPFRPGVFSLVTLVLGLEFLAKPRRALAEAYRALQPGGVLVVAILDRGGPWTLWRRLKRLVAASIWREATFLGADELAALLRAQGFAVERWRRAIYFLPVPALARAGWLERWEAIGVRWMPGRATFVAVAARRA